MKMILTSAAVLVTALSLALLPACASRKEAPDPIKVQEEIAEYRKQELELIRTTILDNQRADNFIRLIGRRDQLISGYVKDIQAYREKMSELNADYNADRSRFDELIGGYNSQRSVAKTAFVDLIAEMKKETTSEEWKVISKYQLKRLHPRALAYGRVQAGG
jgi:hypothetical protein